MATVTYYVYQPFIRVPSGDVHPGPPQEMPTRIAAQIAARRKIKNVVGAIAFKRSGDPTEGHWDDAEIIAQEGEVPSEFLNAEG